MKKIVTIALLILPLQLHAAAYYLDSRLQTQMRENSLSERETPFDVYLDSGLKELPKNGSFDVSLKNDHTFNVGEDGDEFDLYQAVFRMQDLGGVVDISGGRQFLSPGFHAYLLDGASFTFGKDSWPVLIGVFGGVPRYIETGDFHGELGLVSGLTVEANMTENMHTKFSAVYDKLDIDVKNWNENETVLVGMSHSHQFHGSLSPKLYGTMEYDTAGKIIETGLMGLSLEPLKRIYFNLEGGHYNTNRDRMNQTIFGLYGADAFYQGRTGLSVTAVESYGALENMVLTGGYAFQRYDVLVNDAENGHIADGGVNFTISPLFLDVMATYRFYDSFGGRAHDVIFNLHDEPIDRLEIDLGGNFTKYSKVTNDNDTALNGFLMAGVEIFKNFVLSAGGEYLRNNTFSNEWRFTGKLGYKFEGKI